MINTFSITIKFRILYKIITYKVGSDGVVVKIISTMCIVGVIGK